MDLDAIEATLAKAMQLAAEKPGKYGGRYVGRRYDKKANIDRYVICDDDDPEGPESQDQTLDIFALARPDDVFGLGHFRYFINRDGTINRDYFKP
jgi:hypothetical protein